MVKGRASTLGKFMKEIKIASSEDVIKSGRGKYFPVVFFCFYGLDSLQLTLT